MLIFSISEKEKQKSFKQQITIVFCLFSKTNVIVYLMYISSIKTGQMRSSDEPFRQTYLDTVAQCETHSFRNTWDLGLIPGTGRYLLAQMAT